jgi:predicted ATPase/signal transduction histidine kinase
MQVSQLPGFEVDELLYRSSVTTIVRGKRKPDGTAVVLKMSTSDFPSPEETARLRREARILRRLRCPGVVRLLDERTSTLVLRDSGGKSLRDFSSGSPLAMEPFYTIAMRITEALGNVHRHGVFHRNLSADNVLVCPSGEIELIDFGLATDKVEVPSKGGQPSGDLDYISPEQTGRTGQWVDHRTDLYSLGVIFYELVTGSRPFESDDPLETIHGHLARAPVSPKEKEKSLPAPVSELIMKLMAKSPDERYQSANGVLHDLSLCRFIKNGASLQLGASDVPLGLRFPHKLFGRESELAALEETWRRVGEGRQEIVLVSGPAGIGKTSLIKEFNKGVVGPGTFYLRGKCDLLQRDQPLAPLVQALENLVDDLLSMPAVELTRWIDALHRELGDLVAVLVETVPALSKVLGTQPISPEINPAEAANRSHRALSRAFAAISSSQPLVLLLDDMQWVDVGTLRTVELLMSPQENLPILLLLAWRDDELHGEHQLSVTLDRIRDSDPEPLELQLDNLDPSLITLYLAATLRHSPDGLSGLAEIVEQKTHGNPLCIGQFLKAMEERQLLTYCLQSGSWVWNDEDLRKSDVTDNVAAILNSRFQQMPAEALQAVCIASCVGKRFSLDLVAAALELSEDQASSALRPALDMGLLVAEDHHFRFIHDKVYQFAYESLEPERCHEYHLLLGRYLKSRLQSETGPSLFEVTGQFTKALPLIKKRDERSEIGKLFLQAGQRALRGGAFDTALSLAQSGIELLGPEIDWGTQYPLSYQLHTVATSAAFLQGRADQADGYLQELCSKSESPLDRALAMEIRIRYLMRSARYPQALQVCLEALLLVGETIPERSNPARIGLHLGRVMIKLRRMGMDKLAELPISEEPGHLVAMRLLNQGVVCAAFFRSTAVPHLMLRLVERTVRFGRTSESPVAFAHLSLLMSGFLGRLKLGRKIGDVALELARASDPGPNRTRAEFIIHHLSRHWTEPLNNAVASSPTLYRESLDFGDFAFAQIVAWGWVRGSYLSGTELGLVLRRLNRLESEVLVGDAEHPQWGLQRRILDRLISQDFHDSYADSNVDEILETSAAEGNYFATWIYLCGEAYWHLLSDEPMKSLEFVDRLEKNLQYLPGLPEVPHFHYLSTLVRLRSLDKASPALAKKLWKKIQKSRGLLKKWEPFCPENLSHRCWLIDGEVARFHGDSTAFESYDKAAAEARQHGYMMDEAMALERAGEYYFALDRVRLAKTYLQDAVLAWNRWGAVGRASNLIGRFPQLLHSPIPSESARRSVGQVGASLDATSMVKAAQAISHEPVWEGLLRRALELVIENAGATRGVIILNDDDTMLVEAEVDLARPDQVVMVRRDLDLFDNIAASVVRYSARTKEAVVVEDGAHYPKFSNDPYISAGSVRSLLVVPMMSRGREEGWLYLENHLVAKAFTEERAEVVRLIAAQIAVSIENAKQSRQILAQREERHNQEVRIATMEAKKNGMAAFLAIASHDLKNPLASISMWARQIGTGQLEPTMAQNQIEAACKRASGLVRTYLDVVALETENSLSLNLRPVDLARIVEEEIDFRLGGLDPQERGETDLSWNLDKAVLEADEERLQQVVGNLVGNALAYCPTGTPIRVTLTLEDELAKLVLEDEGPGIPLEIRHSLFQPFERGSDEFSSSGLGLWISRVIVEAHGGRIGIGDSGPGANIWVELPLNPSQALLADRTEVWSNGDRADPAPSRRVIK